MSLKALVATPGEIAASRITRDFDFNSHEAHSRLFGEIKEAVDSAVAAEREACAKMLDEAALSTDWPSLEMTFRAIAKAIRARGETT